MLLLVVGLAIGDLVSRRRRDRVAAAASGAELARLHQLTQLAAGGESLGSLIYLVRTELIEILGLDDCEFERPPFFASVPTLRHGGIMMPPRMALPDDRLDAYRQVELPVRGEGLEVGRFVLHLPERTTGIGLAPDARRSAVALADQLGVILVAHSGEQRFL